MSWKYLSKRIISQERSLQVLRRPWITEKSTTATQYNQYSFEVVHDAAKDEVKQAVEKLFNVSVTKVNVINEFGKRKVFRGTKGRQKDIRKAIVTLKQGEVIDFGVGV